MTGDDFRTADPKTSPGPLPTEVSGPKPAVKGPIVNVGGMDPVGAPPANPPVPKSDNPPVPKIDLDLPALPPTPMPDRKDDPPVVAPPKPDAGPKKDDNVPVINLPKPPRTDDLPPLPKIDLGPPAVTVPTGPAPTVDVPAAPVVSPGPTTPPVGPMSTAVAPVKRDTFDEDWHTLRPGEDFAAVSREYYNSADYARALEAYNRDRREKFVRVPPPWVLEERFAGLIQKADSPAVPEARPAANLKPEPAAPAPAPAVPTSRRPAPPPAATPVGSSANPGEYKVTAPNGETIREVAQKVFGNPNLWRRIGELNPDIDPTLTIPTGTSLRIPR
jgi:nucleoid-associated protein YgaU